MQKEGYEKKAKLMKNSIVGLIVLIGLLLITIVMLVDINKGIKKPPKPPEKIYIEKDSGKELENYNRKSAVESLANFFKSLQEDVEGKNRTVEERLKQLDKKETELKDVINQKTLSMLHLHDEFKNVEFNRKFTATALLTYSKIIEESTGSQEISPTTIGLEDLVYFDEELGTVHIPIDVFTGENRGIAFEMNYIDGEWKFTPYTAMMSLVMLVNYEQVIKNEKANSSQSN